MSVEIIPSIKVIGNRHILYDAHAWMDPDADLFRPEHLQEKGLLISRALGRGEAFFFTQGEQEWVLRHYRRGGWVGRLLSDQYLGWDLEASRSWSEWRLLARLHALGLPVPRPVAASVSRGIGFYRADLITRRIAQAIPLAQHLALEPLPAGVWQGIGRCLHRFHDAGVHHADLNARNILLDKSLQPYLIDFDRGRLHGSAVAGSPNLQRLYRSLGKFRRISNIFHFSEADWQELLRGYGTIETLQLPEKAGTPN
jgi:3-deoxy-D-manno-octulosonic acid kinase